MKILVTGGAGFIGSNLTNRLLNHNPPSSPFSKGGSGGINEVVVFDNLSRKGTEKNLDWLRSQHGKDFKLIKGDIRDYPAVKDVVKGVDTIYHCAAQVAVTTSVSNPREDFDINALGTFNILEAARESGNNPVIIFTSTNKVYGGMEDLKTIETNNRYEYKDYPHGISEERPLDFHSPYGCSKGAADQYIRDYARIYGMRTVVFRMSCIYGQRQFGNEDQGWVAHFIISSILGRPLTIYGDGKQIRDILYVDDLINAFILATEKIDITKGSVYNIGGGYKNTLSLLELIDKIESKLDKKIKYFSDKWRPGDQPVYVSNIEKAYKDFGWNPNINKDEGFKQLFIWASENISLFNS